MSALSLAASVLADDAYPLRAITIRQPNASLFAYQVRTVETRGRRCNHRGLTAIHAGKGDDFMSGQYGRGMYGDGDALWRLRDDLWNIPEGEDGFEVIGSAPLGAIVAVGDLTDCLPIVEGVPIGQHDRHEVVIQVLSDVKRLCVLRREPRGGESLRDLTGEMPYGVFTPGRFGLVFSEVIPLPEPVPCRGKQAVPWVVPDDVTEQVYAQLAKG